MDDKEINIWGNKVVSPSVTAVSVEDIQSAFSAVNVNNKRQGLKKWKRIPRELALKTGSRRSFTPVTDSIMQNQISNLNEESSVSVDEIDDHPRNCRDEPGKKARGFQNIEGESESSRSNFVCLQGSNTAARYDEESSVDKELNEDPQIEFIKSDAESDDGKRGKHGKHERLKDQDPLVESIKGLEFAYKEFEREVEKWRDVGKDDPLMFTDPMLEILELKDAKILELELALSSGGIKTELEDCLMKVIQADVENVVITETTKRLTEGPLREIKHNLQHKTVSSLDTQETKKQDGNVETKESLKTMQSRVCRFTSRFMIQLILLLVTLYLKFSPQSVEVVPT